MVVCRLGNCVNRFSQRGFFTPMTAPAAHPHADQIGAVSPTYRVHHRPVFELAVGAMKPILSIALDGEEVVEEIPPHHLCPTSARYARVSSTVIRRRRIFDGSSKMGIFASSAQLTS